jgi:hypothetical protein
MMDENDGVPSFSMNVVGPAGPGATGRKSGKGLVEPGRGADMHLLVPGEAIGYAPAQWDRAIPYPAVWLLARLPVRGRRVRPS